MLPPLLSRDPIPSLRPVAASLSHFAVQGLLAIQVGPGSVRAASTGPRALTEQGLLDPCFNEFESRCDTDRVLQAQTRMRWQHGACLVSGFHDRNVTVERLYSPPLCAPEAAPSWKKSKWNLQIPRPGGAAEGASYRRRRMGIAVVSPTSILRRQEMRTVASY
jgi:hypothetical protein